MLFSPQTLFWGTAALASLIGLAAGDDSKHGPCYEGPFGDTSSAGASGGDFICDTKWMTGSTVTGIEVWASKGQINGIQFAYGDGSKSPVRGRNVEAGNRHAAITWQDGDTITKLNIWSNKDKNAVGRIQLEVSNGQKLDVSVKHTDGVDGQPVLTHSGLLLGARGGAKEKINWIEFLFMESNIGKAEMTEIEFKEDLDEWNAKKKGIDPSFILNEVYIVNSNAKKNGTGGVEKGFYFRNSRVKTVSKDLTQSAGNSFGGSATLTVGGEIKVPLFTSATTSLGSTGTYSHDTMSSASYTETYTQTLFWEETGTIIPGRAVHCVATAATGVYRSEYNSTVTIKMADGNTFNITQPGTYTSVGWSLATSNCKDIAASEAPKTAFEAGEQPDDPEDTTSEARDVRANDYRHGTDVYRWFKIPGGGGRKSLSP
ncbi:hypothetical protein HYFRA_00000221 [Hymenoscyphus fraxineus]|uniref:Jacalin-type lectin domain-containing protein n=1 Tax=Hymenoscyphus fraxineus TaxID=746836 RepID=A0A9N9L159_9HELO|nr:hypothetical protein HYFRA_00000221 [Hymenoscyphus fraxineus]